jgi:hypothetical protein
MRWVLVRTMVVGHSRSVVIRTSVIRSKMIVEHILTTTTNSNGAQEIAHATNLDSDSENYSGFDWVSDIHENVNDHVDMWYSRSLIRYSMIRSWKPRPVKVKKSEIIRVDDHWTCTHWGYGVGNGKAITWKNVAAERSITTWMESSDWSMLDKKKD